MTTGQHITQKVSNISRASDAVPFHDFSWGTGEVTEGEKAAAERGAAARGTYGAKRDHCKRGKSCGAACIFYRKDCVLELPVTVQNAIRGARRIIVDKMSRGEISGEDAERLFLQKTNLGSIDPNKQLGKAAKDVVWEKQGDRVVRAKGAAQGRPAEGLQDLKKAVKPSSGGSDGDLEQRYLDVKEAIKGGANVKGLREQIPNASERSARIRELFDLALDKGYGIYGEKGQYRPKRPEEMTEDFAKGVLNNQSFISKMNSIEANYRAGNITTAQYNTQMDEAKSFMFSKVNSDAEVLMMSAFLSPGARAYLMTAGTTVSPNVYQGRFPNRVAVPVGEEVGATKEVRRAWMMQNLKFMMNTEFKEIYSQLPYKIHQVDLEHLTPESEAKRFGGANVGGNKSFAFSKANQTRSNDPLSFFLADNPNGMFSGKLFNADGTSARTGTSTSTLKGGLERMITQRDRDVNTIISTLAAIPARDLKASDRAGMLAKIVVEHTQSARSVTVGMETARGEKSYHWFGGKTPGWSGAGALGERMAQAVGRWEQQGDEGSRKIIQLKGLMDRTGTLLRDINNLEANGQPIRRQIVTAPGVKEIREREFESRMQSMMPEFNALLDS